MTEINCFSNIIRYITLETRKKVGTIAIQISSEILEGLVLSLLSKEDFYGYSLTQGVKEFLPISDSTMYPILRRLKKNDQVTTYDKSFDGRNRRYYQITDNGKARLLEIKNDWENHKKIVDKVFKEEGDKNE